MYSVHRILHIVMLRSIVMRFCNLFFPWNQYFRSDMRWMSRSIMFAFCISFHRINCRTANSQCIFNGYWLLGINHYARYAVHSDTIRSDAMHLYIRYNRNCRLPFKFIFLFILLNYNHIHSYFYSKIALFSLLFVLFGCCCCCCCTLEYRTLFILKLRATLRLLLW